MTREEWAEEMRLAIKLRNRPRVEDLIFIALDNGWTTPEDVIRLMESVKRG